MLRQCIQCKGVSPFWKPVAVSNELGTENEVVCFCAVLLQNLPRREK